MQTSTLASKTTFSSRSKMAQPIGLGGETNETPKSGTDATATTTRNRILNEQPVSRIASATTMPPPNQPIAQGTRALKQPTLSSQTRLANLVNGIPTCLKKPGVGQVINGSGSNNDDNNNYNNNNNNSNGNITRSNGQVVAKTPKIAGSLRSTISTSARTHNTNLIRTNKTSIATSRLPPPMTSAKVLQPKTAMLSSTAIKRPSVATNSTNSIASSRDGLSSITSIKDNTRQSSIPDTNQIRRGLAKFSNPMECQRQILALSQKITSLEEAVEVRDKTVVGLQEQLDKAVSAGIGYATVVQYLALKLKLDKEIDLTKECELLKERIKLLEVNEAKYEEKLEGVLKEYKEFLRIEQDLKTSLELELLDTKEKHSNEIETLKSLHIKELDDLSDKHSCVKTELEERIGILSAELDSQTRELSELRREHELLNNDFNKLEESLTKDKDARVKYLQEKINQLQKDVESLNSVLEMRTEKIHSLEKDSLLLIEAQNDLIAHKDTIKALNQQLESVNATLDKKREQYENLLAEHEKLRQEFKKERNERRRMTMKSEQLEYVLNESCASESNLVMN